MVDDKALVETSLLAYVSFVVDGSVVVVVALGIFAIVVDGAVVVVTLPIVDF